MTLNRKLLWALSFVLLFSSFIENADARRRRRKRQRLPTHPVVLWVKTINESQDPEQRKVAAFKLSKYTVPFVRSSTIETLLKCVSDSDLNVKVLCTKALSNTRKHTYDTRIRKTLLELHKSDPLLRNTIVRTLIAREESHSDVYNALYNHMNKTNDPEELVVLLKYFEAHGNGSSSFVNSLVTMYNKHEPIRVRMGIAKALGERANGQSSVVALFSECAGSKDTPLQLTCLSGLEAQAKKDVRAWTAVEKTITSKDPDVLIATLDVINSLPVTENTTLAQKLLKIVEEVDDPEVREKAVLALGVTGNESEQVVKSLQEVLEDPAAPEQVRIASALILGEQSALYPNKPRLALKRCHKGKASQSLRTACQLGLNDLEVKAKAAVSRRNQLATEKANTARKPANKASK